MQKFRILAINPGSTSTKVALFQGNEPVISQTLEHTDRELSASNKVLDQLDMRESAIRAFMDENRRFDYRCGGGQGRPAPAAAGGYVRVNDAMCRDLEEARYGEHASNLGPLLAHGSEKCWGCPPISSTRLPLMNSSPLQGFPAFPVSSGNAAPMP